MNLTFLHADKYQSGLPTSSFQHFGQQGFLQRNIIIIDEHDEPLSKHSK